MFKVNDENARKPLVFRCFRGYIKVENWLTNSAAHYTKKYSIG